jgi:hypothetical protein
MYSGKVLTSEADFPTFGQNAGLVYPMHQGPQQMNQDDDNPMPDPIKDILAEESHPGRRMCFTPAELAGDWKAFEPMRGHDDIGDQGSNGP